MINKITNEFITDQMDYNKQIRGAWIDLWVKNAAINYEFIKNVFKSYDADLYTFQASHKKSKHCIILGSGPSLDDILPILHNWEGDIYCSSSQLQTLEYYKIKPTACCIIDADPAMTHLVSLAETSQIPLFTHPCMDPAILKLWRGRMYFFRAFDPSDLFFAETLPKMYQVLDVKKSQELNKHYGVVSHVLNCGNVVNTLFAILGTFNYENIFLSGVDLGFPNGQMRFTNYTKGMDGEFTKQPPVALTPINAPHISNNGIPTDKVSLFYKYSFMINYGMDKHSALSCSRGIISELPQYTAQEVIDCQGDVKIPETHNTPQKRYKIAQAYLKERELLIMSNSKIQSVRSVADCRLHDIDALKKEISDKQAALKKAQHENKLRVKERARRMKEFENGIAKGEW